MISYAQSFEDVYLARAFDGQREGFYIDVGAFHPTVDSVTKHLYDLGWHGVNVEPLPAHIELFRSERPRDINVQAALGDRHGTVTLYHSHRSLAYAEGSTLRADLAATMRARGLPVRAVTVPVLTLAELCRDYVPPVTIDFLKVDVEGMEAQVIAGGDWSQYRPRLVIVESVEPETRRPSHEAWESMLLQAGYAVAWCDGVNRYYLRPEDRELGHRLSCPPNARDQIVTARAAWAEAEAARLRERLAGLLRRARYLDDVLALGEGALRGQYRIEMDATLDFASDGSGWTHALDGWLPTPDGAALPEGAAGLLVECESGPGDIVVSLDVLPAGRRVELWVNGLAAGSVTAGEEARVRVPASVWRRRAVAELRVQDQDRLDQVLPPGAGDLLVRRLTITRA
jgi:FkbM family methyltransferase